MNSTIFLAVNRFNYCC